MKTKLLFLFAFLSFNFTSAQIVNIPNVILKAKLLEANPDNGIASPQTPVYNNNSGWWYVSGYNSIDSNGDGEIQVSEAQAIKWLALVNLDLSDITGIEAFSNLEYLALSGNQLQDFNISNLTHLRYLDVGHNYLQSLDVTSFPSLRYMWCYNNQLKSLFIKNNANWVSLGFDSNNNMEYVCADENDLTFVQDRLNQYNYTSCHVNSYCSFTPGGTFYTINGNSRRDLDNNGCDANDNPYANLKLNITSGSQSGGITCNEQGNYSIPVQAGTHTLTPVLENPSYFTAISPTITFPANISPFNHDFCVTANGIHHDVEVTIIPIGVARPGFDAYYKIIYKNKATAIEEGSIQFSFDDAVLDLISASPSFTNQVANTLTWDYFSLQPLETRTIMVVLNVNSPMEIPAVNIGHQLNYQAAITITTPNIDEMPLDNIFGLNQTVVGSYDPNDITCLQGNTIGSAYVGNYVHYLIRFENTGTYPAENVVIKDIIDTAKFDINTLQTILTSHSCYTRISGNKVEFIYEDINLPFDDASNDGYVAFKIKTKPNLVIGDTFSNLANIYFDYNFPIVTNNYTTTIQNTLGQHENNFSNDISVYPNPVKNSLQLKTETTVIKVEVYDITGRLVSSNSINENKIDLSELKTGSYILKLYTEKGIMTTKIIKE